MNQVPFKEMLKQAFTPPEVKNAEKPAPAPVPEAPPPVPEVKLPEAPSKTVKDIRIVAQAQRIYNPAMPPAPAKQPTEKMIDQGTAPAMDNTGPWGKPSG